MSLRIHNKIGIENAKSFYLSYSYNITGLSGLIDPLELSSGLFMSFIILLNLFTSFFIPSLFILDPFRSSAKLIHLLNYSSLWFDVFQSVSEYSLTSLNFFILVRLSSPGYMHSKSPSYHHIFHFTFSHFISHISCVTCGLLFHEEKLN